MPRCALRDLGLFCRIPTAVRRWFAHRYSECYRSLWLAALVIGLRLGRDQTSLVSALDLHQWCFCWALRSLCLRILCDVPTTISLKLSLPYCCRCCITVFRHKDSASCFKIEDCCEGKRTNSINVSLVLSIKVSSRLPNY